MPLPRETQAARPKAQAIPRTFDLCQSLLGSHRSTRNELPETTGRFARGVRITASGSFLPFHSPRAPEEKERFPSVSSVSPLPGGRDMAHGFGFRPPGIGALCFTKHGIACPSSKDGCVPSRVMVAVGPLRTRAPPNILHAEHEAGLHGSSLLMPAPRSCQWHSRGSCCAGVLLAGGDPWEGQDRPDLISIPECGKDVVTTKTAT